MPAHGQGVARRSQQLWFYAHLYQQIFNGSLGRDVFRWKGPLEPGTCRILWFYAMPPTGAAGLWEHTRWPGCGPGPLQAGVLCTQRSPPLAHLLTKTASSRGASFAPGWLSRKLSQLVSHCHCGAGPVPERTLQPRPPADRHQRMGAGAAQGHGFKMWRDAGMLKADHQQRSGIFHLISDISTGIDPIPSGRKDLVPRQGG